MKETNVKSNKKWLFALLPFGIVLHFIIILAIMFGLFVLVYSCEDTSYYENAKWNATNEEFETICVDFYYDSITEIMGKYDIDCNQKIDKYSENVYDIYVYNENFTLCLTFINLQTYANADFKLYYYGDGTKSSLANYDDQRNLVNALNDFTNLVAYDAKVNENRFESLYDDCIKTKEQYASDNIHFDNLIGYVEYAVSTNSNNSYYYKMQMDDSIDVSCNIFSFKGILKGVDC